MKRGEWVFQYKTMHLLEAARSRRMYHEDRVAHWKDQLTTAEQTLKDKGIDIRAMPITGGYRNDIVLDPQLSARVSECSNKVREHEGKRDEYWRWERTFAKSSQGVLDLNADDVTYFGVADNDAATA